MTAQLGDAGFERGPGPRRGRLEDQGDGATVQRVGAQRRRFELIGTAQQPPELGRRELLPGEQVSRQARQCTLGAVRLRVLTWNLFHGRSVPASRRYLFDEFAQTLDGWDWDIALLQEVPPWWPRQLAERLACEHASVLTSRNALLPLRRALATRWPDLMKSGGGGANAILARDDRIVEQRSARLCRRPERRMAHGVQLAYGLWVINLHTTAHDAEHARRPVDPVRHVEARPVAR